MITMVQLITESEMEHKFDVEKMSAIDISIEKYKRIFQAIKEGQKINRKDVMADTCALCYSHAGNCDYCGLKIVEGTSCDDGITTWRNVYMAISGDADDLILEIEKMIKVLNRVKDEGLDCLDSKIFVTCQCCGEKFPNFMMTFHDDFGFICSHCYEEMKDVGTCTFCAQYVDIKNTTVTEDGLVCDRCLENYTDRCLENDINKYLKNDTDRCLRAGKQKLISE